MKKIIILAMLAILTLSSVCFADTYVHGYRRSNGTYVQGLTCPRFMYHGEL